MLLPSRSTLGSLIVPSKTARFRYCLPAGRSVSLLSPAQAARFRYFPSEGRSLQRHLCASGLSPHCAVRERVAVLEASFSWAELAGSVTSGGRTDDGEKHGCCLCLELCLCCVSFRLCGGVLLLVTWADLFLYHPALRHK